MAGGFKLEQLVHFSEVAVEKGILTVEAQEEYIRSQVSVTQESPDQIRDFFNNLLPGQNVGDLTPEEQEQRKLEHENVYNSYIRLVAEYGSITRSPNTRREMSALYKPERTKEDIDYNKRLREIIDNQDYKELGRIYSEHIMNMPSYDPETLQNLSDMEAPQVFCALYPLYVATQEAHKLLNDQSPEAMAIKEGMSEESKAQLARIVDDMDPFSVMKLQCDSVFSPYHQYIDYSKIAPTQESVELVSAPPEELMEGASIEMQYFVANLSNSLSYSINAIGRNVELQLEKAGIDPNQAVALDFQGKEYPFQPGRTAGCREVLQRGEPLFCTSGNQLKVFTLDNGKLVEMQPAEAVAKCKEIYPARNVAALEKADSILNSKTASPRWLLTGSRQYNDMKKALAQYKAAVQGRPGEAELESPEAMTALKALQTAAKAYLKHKGVDLDQYPDFNSFTDPYQDNPMADRMSKRELARMEAAYSVLDIYRNTVGSFNMQIELPSKPAYNAPLAMDAVPYNQMVQQLNENIRQSAFLNNPVPAAENNNAGELVRQDLNNALTDPQNGLLNKKIFTLDDRKAAEDVFAKAVILEMIRTGRGITQTSPVAIEKSYLKDPTGVINQIKQTEAFRNAVGEHITPGAVRNFFIENRQAGVNKSLLGAAVQQKAEATDMQKQVEPERQLHEKNPQLEVPKAPIVGMG